MNLSKEQIERKLMWANIGCAIAVLAIICVPIITLLLLFIVLPMTIAVSFVTGIAFFLLYWAFTHLLCKHCHNRVKYFESLKELHDGSAAISEAVKKSGLT